MTNLNLPGPVARYIAAANAQEPDAVTACFSEGAAVRDEGLNRHGIATIRDWAANVSRKYQPKLEVIDAVEQDGKTIVTLRVSGDFPGSPIELRYTFTLQGEKISRLEIA